MAIASKTNGKGISLEERFANVSGQLSCVTERLGRAEHDLDLERASREDIISAEVELRLREREKALEAEYEEKRRRLDQEKKEHEEMLRKRMERHDEELRTSYANMAQRVIAETKEQIEEARKKAESNSYSKLSQQLELFMKAFLQIMDGNSPEGQALLKQYREAAREAEATLKEEVKEALDNAEKKANKKAQHIESLVRMLFLSTPPMEGIKGVSNGRGKKIIEANLSEWTGQALLCDAYAGYDWVKKLGRVLCRCDAHARRKMESALKENSGLARIGMTLHQQIYAVEDMIKAEERSMGRKMTSAEKVQFRNENARHCGTTSSCGARRRSSIFPMRAGSLMRWTISYATMTSSLPIWT